MFTSSVYIDDHIFGCDGNSAQDGINKPTFPLGCIDAETGDIAWEEIMNIASLIAADGKLILLEEDGTLRIAEAIPSSYKGIFRAGIYGSDNKARQFWTPPVLYKGKIYCRDAMGSLICIDVSI